MIFNARTIMINDMHQAEHELSLLNCDEIGLQIMSEKALFKIIKLEQIASKAANLLKQTFLAKGAEVAIARGCADLSIDRSDVLILATLKQYHRAISQLRLQPWGLPTIAKEIERVLENEFQPIVREYNWPGKKIEIKSGRTIIMGILNITPDSFSDGGSYNRMDLAVRRAEQIIQEGADIIDIGAESTRPYDNSCPITAAEEKDRLLPILKKILEMSPIPISVDTYKAEVAEAALQLGAHIINDVWGLQQDGEMAAVISKFQVPVVIMHNKTDCEYQTSVMSAIISFLNKSIDIGVKAGIPVTNFIIDPGIGFGKMPQQNLQIMTKLHQLKSLGCPILIGPSRKKFIGEVMNLPIDQRVEGTGVAVTMGIQQGVNIVRVHDVKAMVRVAKTTDTILRGEYNDR